MLSVLQLHTAPRQGRRLMFVPVGAHGSQPGVATHSKPRVGLNKILLPIMFHVDHYICGVIGLNVAYSPVNVKLICLAFGIFNIYYVYSL